MTEKRYYQRDFEELYYIIDSEVISEAEFDDKYLYEGYSAFEESLTGEEIVELLNENEELKKELSDLRKENYGNLDGLAYKDEVEIPKLSERISDLECENEQLKKENSKHIVDYNGLNCEYGGLKEENEQLNSRIRYLENKIQRERNATTNQHLRWSDEAETKIKELSKENEELREQVKCLLEDLQSTNQINKEIVDDVREELLKENEQLKSEITTLKGGYDEYEEIIGELKAENEQLKKDREDLKRYLVVKDREIMKLRKENNEMKFNKKR